MNNKLLLTVLTTVGFAFGASSMPAQAQGWLNGFGGMYGGNSGLAGNMLNTWHHHHHHYNNGLLGSSGWNNGLGYSGWNNGWHNGWNNGWGNRWNSGYNNGGGFFGGNLRGLLGRDEHLINEQNHIQSLLSRGNLTPQQTANLQNRLARIQSQESNLNGLLGSRITNQQSYLQNLLSSGNLNPQQAAWAQNQLSQLQNAQAGIAAGNFNPSAYGGLRRLLGF